MQVIYMKTTLDKFELPIAVADTIKELAAITGNSYGTIATSISKNRKGVLIMVTMKWLFIIMVAALFIWVIYSWGYSDGYEDAKEENIIDMQNVFRTK